MDYILTEGVSNFHNKHPIQRDWVYSQPPSPIQKPPAHHQPTVALTGIEVEQSKTHTQKVKISCAMRSLCFDLANVSGRRCQRQAIGDVEAATVGTPFSDLMTQEQLPVKPQQRMEIAGPCRIHAAKPRSVIWGQRKWSLPPGGGRRLSMKNCVTHNPR